ncbi:MAG: PilZ domain-containing protein [Desulfobacteraceae bacterium]|nr:PilZ domain-containing protein [Desulfobacteraceae bacterium]
MQIRSAAATFGGDECEATEATVDRLPLEIGDEMVIRSQTTPALRTKTTVLGALHGEYIIIKEPVVPINKRISSCIEGAFTCYYFKNEYLYTFLGECRKTLIDDIICIYYPKLIEVKQVRKHRRIRVNIEVEFFLEDASESILGDMLDISQGGCRVVLNTLAPLRKGACGRLTFNLPNDEHVEEIQCTAMSVKATEDYATTEIGMCFAGPPLQLEVIAKFCEFCLYFDIE